MTDKERYSQDIEAILSHRHDNGADLWTTPDRRLIKGSPFSTLESVMYLLELGMEPSDPLLQEAAALIFSAWGKDGRFRVYPQGAIYPCQTIHAANTLCHLGYAADERIMITLRHLLDTRQPDGGWRMALRKVLLWQRPGDGLFEPPANAGRTRRLPLHPPGERGTRT